MIKLLKLLVNRAEKEYNKEYNYYYIMKYEVMQ